MKALAYLVEEFDAAGTLVRSMIMTSSPTELSWSQELKSKLHNVTITPLVADTANVIKVTNVKKYDSSRFVTGL